MLRAFLYSPPCAFGHSPAGKRSDIYSWDLIQSVPERSRGCAGVRPSASGFFGFCFCAAVFIWFLTSRRETLRHCFSEIHRVRTEPVRPAGALGGFFGDHRRGGSGPESGTSLCRLGRRGVDHRRSEHLFRPGARRWLPRPANYRLIAGWRSDPFFFDRDAACSTGEEWIKQP